MAVKKVIVLTADRFEDMELFFPLFRLIEEGVEVDVAGPKKGEISGEHGYDFEIKMTFDEVDPSKYDMLFLPGGDPAGAPTTVRKNLTAQKIAKAFSERSKPIVAICHGPYTLISAGLVKGKKMTSFWGDGVPEELKKGGASYVDAEVVVDGNWVTSRYPGDLPAFMREVMKLVRSGKPVSGKKKA